jgi:hypothetical protein
LNISGDRTAAVERSRWLAELAQAVDEALRLARAMEGPQRDCARAKEIHARLKQVRIEIDALRRGGWGTRPIEIDPLWTRFLTWTAHPED